MFPVEVASGLFIYPFDVFQDDVDKFTPAELAVVMMSSACVAEAKKLGIDPTKIKVRLDFGETKRHMCFKLEKEKR